MASVHFEHLYLLSSAEQRGLSVPLNAPKVIIEGGNGFGKSAIIKSLFQTLGATPQKIDQRWTTAEVSSCLFFRLDGRPLAAVRTLGTHALFDRDTGDLLFTGRRLVADWGPRLAEVFGFKLEMTDYQGEVITPPPAYIFAPYYVDQDRGWTKPWASFVDFRALPATVQTLADYHSGLRPNEYYAAKAAAQRDRLELAGVEGVISSLRDSIARIEGVEVVAGPTLDLVVFAAETDRLVARSEDLLARQRTHRRKMLDLHEEVHLVRAELKLLEGALNEMRGAFATASGVGGDIECPTCGVIYENNLADRFGLIRDEQVLIEAMGAAKLRLDALAQAEKDTRGNINDIEAALSEIDIVLQTKHADLSFNDVVAAAGRTEAMRLLGSSLDERQSEADTISARIDQHRAVMEKFKDAKRTKAIKDRFFALLTLYAAKLDVALEDSRTRSIAALKVARGSEGPRGLLAYYYAFLQVTAEFSDGVRMPIVIDAPNQQGQDAAHLPAMLDFILNQAPQGRQIIVAVEDVGDIDRTGLDIRTYGERKRQVLRDDAYEDVAAILSPFQESILAAVAGDPPLPNVQD